MVGKKKIKDFQNALKSNTSYISADDSENKVEEKVTGTKKKPVKKAKANKKEFETPIIKPEHHIELIDKDILEKMDILADYMNHTPSYLVNLALKHFLGLKLLRLEEAMEAHKAKQEEE